MIPNTFRSLSTSGLAPKQQIQCWTDALADLCGHFDIDPLKVSSFEGRIHSTTISKLTLCQIEASQHRIAHRASSTKPGGHPFVKILFQTHGVSHFEQSGHSIKLIPGDCLAYDVSCPHTIVSPALTRHEVVVVPHDLLQERGFRSSKMSACKLSARTGIGRIAYNLVHAIFDEATRLSANSTIGVADSLIDLLLLPLREADTMFDRAGSEAMYVRAQFFIREHLRDPELSIGQIAATLGCTKRYLHMLFKDRGTTISDYVLHARLQNSRHELETQPEKAITDVASSWGFASLSHYSRVFREHFGVTPSAVRKAQHDGLRHGGLSSDFSRG